MLCDRRGYGSRSARSGHRASGGELPAAAGQPVLTAAPRSLSICPLPHEERRCWLPKIGL